MKIFVLKRRILLSLFYSIFIWLINIIDEAKSNKLTEITQKNIEIQELNEKIDQINQSFDLLTIKYNNILDVITFYYFKPSLLK